MNCRFNEWDIEEYLIYDTEKDCPVSSTAELMLGAGRLSCGNDVFCREGTVQAGLLAQSISKGEATTDDLELLREVIEIVHANADCEMARSAAKQALWLLDEYPDVWEQHVTRKLCPMLACKALYTVHADPAKCTGCGACTAVCPQGAIRGGEGLIHIIDNDKCDRCGACIAVCPESAIIKAGSVKPKTPDEPVPAGTFEGGGRRKRRGRA
ncbi:MAG: 4Fe-4S binding protein [Clostridiales Family XIII bacterium]|jgi:NADH-quinone oxidoreductase subunit F|nr:4Fe-4S binding protein [Clostridiales Family XIII bacterium]